MQSPLHPQSLSLSAVPRALAAGWRTYGQARWISLVVGGIVALVGSLLLWGVHHLNLAPMAVPLLGGFLLVGPVLMAALLGVSQAVLAGQAPSWRDGLGAWRAAPAGLAAVALFCCLIFFIWLGDAGTLYSFLVEEGEGSQVGLLPARPGVLPFHLSVGITGLVLALIVFVVTVHTVPLLATGRASLVQGVVASVRAVFRSPLAHAAWALVLAAGVFVGLLAPPLLVLSLPVLAYGGHALHLEVFPRR